MTAGAADTVALPPTLEMRAHSVSALRGSLVLGERRRSSPVPCGLDHSVAYSRRCNVLSYSNTTARLLPIVPLYAAQRADDFGMHIGLVLTQKCTTSNYATSSVSAALSGADCGTVEG